MSCFLNNSRERLQGLTKPSVKSLTGKNRVGKGTQTCVFLGIFFQRKTILSLSGRKTDSRNGLQGHIRSCHDLLG